MAAKAALNQMSRFVAYQDGRDGIRANIPSPGLTLTLDEIMASIAAHEPA